MRSQSATRSDFAIGGLAIDSINILELLLDLRTIASILLDTLSISHATGIWLHAHVPGVVVVLDVVVGETA